MIQQELIDPRPSLCRVYSSVGVDRRIVDRHGQELVEQKCREKALVVMDELAAEQAYNLVLSHFHTHVIDDPECPQILFNFSMGAIRGN